MKPIKIMLEISPHLADRGDPMSSQSRIELYREAMTIEHERATLQGKLDQLHTRLNQIKGALFSPGASASLPVAPAGKVTAATSAPSPKKARSARGELKPRILEALAAAGKEGIRVRDLAVSIGSKPEALHSWFQFARKSNRAIRKAGKGRYRLVGTVSEAPIAAPKAKATPKLTRAAKNSSGSPRGQLSEAIHTALQAAGKAGARVNDLAKTMGANPRNLFVWFATTGKKFKAIKKVSPGHYALRS